MAPCGCIQQKSLARPQLTLNRILSYLGLIKRRGNESVEKLIVVRNVEGKRPRGRSPNRWSDQLRETGARTFYKAIQMAKDRTRWREIIVDKVVGEDKFLSLPGGYNCLLRMLPVLKGCCGVTGGVVRARELAMRRAPGLDNIGGQVGDFDPRLPPARTRTSARFDVNLSVLLKFVS
ncbi:jg16728 [Pararge aegeria aegeria]|uniref:Jg16728 protein n=1 Tax=Pararge aegeria aegeria TaxID=348720 RepID=A0A8S4S321_9NEOP|nr:jg16728 [Pararge aegeria aegeria]